MSARQHLAHMSVAVFLSVTWPSTHSLDPNKEFLFVTSIFYIVTTTVVWSNDFRKKNIFFYCDIRQLSKTINVHAYIRPVALENMLI